MAAHNRIVGNTEPALHGYPTSRWLALSLFTQLAGGDADVAVWRLPACGRAQCESRPVGLQACPSVSRSRSHCATGRCYSDPHTVESGVLHLPVTAASLVECIRFSALVPAFQLPIRLRVVRRGSDMRHARDANELLQIAGNELRAIVRDNAWLCFRVLFLGAFENYFDISFPHRLAQIPMHKETAEPVQNAAQVVERAAQVDVGNVDVPVLVRLRRLLETTPLARRSPLPPRQQSSLLQHPPNARWTDGDNVSVKHHERQPPITLQRILQVEADDRFFLPRLQPEIPGNPTVVLVDAPVPLPPVIELASGHAQPLDKPSDTDLRPFRPAPDEIHHLVPHIRRHPLAG